LFAGLIYAAGGIAATLAHIALQTGFGLNTMAGLLQGESSILSVFFSSFRLMSFAIGFAIGAIIIREVRRIAHTQLIAPEVGESGAAAAAPVVKTWLNRRHGRGRRAMLHKA